MRHETVTGIDAYRQIRLFERTNDVPPCFLIASDGARAILINLNELRQKVVYSGVDCVLPWYSYTLPLYDALAGVKKRTFWGRLVVGVEAGVAESITSSEQK